MVRLFSLLICLLPLVADARGIYQQPEDFINEVFNGAAPKAKKIWITKSIRPIVSDILAHPPTQLRVRYWGQQHRTAWVLNEIGKEKPITLGIVINNNKIERVKVLIFRESRGWEVRHSFFTDQFSELGIKKDTRLDKSIDGISGATLSVRAIKKLSRLALYLHQQTEFANDAP